MLDLITGATTVALYVSVQLLYLRPPHPSDQTFYFYRAGEFPDPAIFEHKTLRIGLLLPIKVGQRLFGTSEAAYYLVPLLAGALLIASTYLVGRILFGRLVGGGAAILLLFSPLFLLESSHLLPDIPAAALTAAAIAVMLIAAERSANMGQPISGALLILTGLLFGWAYLTREFVVLLFPVAVVIFHLYKLPWRRITFMVVPIIAIWIGETILNGVLYGEPFARLTVAGGHSAGVPLPGADRLDLFFRLPTNFARIASGETLVILLILLVLGAVIRERSYRISLAWFALLWIPLTLLSGIILDPEFRFLRTHKLRYWMPVVPIILIGGLAVMHRLIERFSAVEIEATRVRRLFPVIATSLFVLFTTWYGFEQIRESKAYRVNGANQLADFRGWLKDHGHDVQVIWTDDRTMNLLPLYTSNTFGGRIWHGELRSFQANDPDPFDDVVEFVPKEQLNTGAIVIYNFGLNFLPENRHSVPDYILFPERSAGWIRFEPDDQEQMVIYKYVGIEARDQAAFGPP